MAVLSGLVFPSLLQRKSAELHTSLDVTGDIQQFENGRARTERRASPQVVVRIRNDGNLGTAFDRAIFKVEDVAPLRRCATGVVWRAAMRSHAQVSNSRVASAAIPAGAVVGDEFVSRMNFEVDADDSDGLAVPVVSRLLRRTGPTAYRFAVTLREVSDARHTEIGSVVVVVGSAWDADLKRVVGYDATSECISQNANAVLRLAESSPPPTMSRELAAAVGAAS